MEQPGWFEVALTPEQAVERLRAFVANMDATNAQNTYKSRRVASELRAVLEVTEGGGDQ